MSARETDWRHGARPGSLKPARRDAVDRRAQEYLAMTHRTRVGPSGGPHAAAHTLRSARLPLVGSDRHGCAFGGRIRRVSPMAMLVDITCQGRKGTGIAVLRFASCLSLPPRTFEGHSVHSRFSAALA